jgi:hypothetical protein
MDSPGANSGQLALANLQYFRKKYVTPLIE